jgi:hypothetical protein
MGRRILGQEYGEYGQNVPIVIGIALLALVLLPHRTSFSPCSLGQCAVQLAAVATGCGVFLEWVKWTTAVGEC